MFVDALAGMRGLRWIASSRYAPIFCNAFWRKQCPKQRKVVQVRLEAIEEIALAEKRGLAGYDCLNDRKLGPVTNDSRLSTSKGAVGNNSAHRLAEVWTPSS